MPLYSADFNQIFNITPPWHVLNIQNVIGFQPNFKHSSLRAYEDHPYHVYRILQIPKYSVNGSNLLVGKIIWGAEQLFF